jgi:chloride channel protein, CIC family
MHQDASLEQGAIKRLIHAYRCGIQHAFHGHRPLRWVIFSVAIGAASGLMACLIFFLLEWSTYFCWEYLAGYHPSKPAGEQLVELVASTPFRPWLLCLLPALGGLLSGLIVYTWAPEAEGHGTDAFIDAFHNKQGLIRTRVPFIKGLASVITLSTGGSAGREGPIAQIGAGIGSWLGRVFNMGIRERRLMLLAGCAGGLGAIFRAPLGGALTSIEVLYREDFETEGIILCIISSVVANSIFTSIFGHQAIFETPATLFQHPVELLFYVALGLVCVPFGFIYVKVFYGLRDRFFRKLRWKRALVPAFGGILVGLIGLWKPQILSGGYGTIQQALRGELTVELLLILAMLKIVATAFTISSGGSGGVFGPSLFIGAMLGGAVGQISHQWFPGIISHPGAFALVGMGAFFAGVAKAPLGALLMVCEMTGGYGLVVPLMLTSVLVILLSQRWSLYEKQVINKFHSPAHRADTIINVLQMRTVQDIFRPDRPIAILPEDMSFAHLRRFITKTRESFFAVVNDNFELRGVLSLPDLRQVMFEKCIQDLVILRDVLSPPVSVALHDSLYDALVTFLECGYGRIPVTDQENGVVGMLRLEDLMEAYYSEILQQQDPSKC